MSAGMFPSPGCGCCGCTNDGQFVWAWRDLSGYRGVGWETVPATLEKLYRKATITHTKSVYYYDVGTESYVYWKDYIMTIVVEWDADCGQVVKFSATGSLNGLVQSFDTCAETSFTKAYEDWDTETAPNGDAGWDDLPPWPGTYPAGGSDISEIVSAAEDSVTYRYTASDGTNTLFKLVTTIAMEDVLDTATVRTMVGDMMATVPLTKGTPVSISGENPDKTAASGTWGFPTRGAGYNHAYVFYDVTDCCTKDLVTVLNLISSDDDRCQCSLHYVAPDWPLWVYRDRRQSYMPAAFALSIPGSVGGGSGALYSTGTTAAVLYGWKMRWYDAGSGIELQSERDPNALDTYEASAQGKKSLLSRGSQDDWTVLENPDGTNECLEPTPVTKCYRYYYPTDSDEATASADSEVFTLDEGQIYRAIPAKTLEMDADCPSPESGEIACPNGGDGTDDGVTDPNPCL